MFSFGKCFFDHYYFLKNKKKPHQHPLIKKKIMTQLVWKESVPFFQKLYRAKKQKENIDDYQAVVLSLQKQSTVAE